MRCIHRWPHLFLSSVTMSDTVSACGSVPSGTPHQPTQPLGTFSHILTWQKHKNIKASLTEHSAVLSFNKVCVKSYCSSCCTGSSHRHRFFPALLKRVNFLLCATCQKGPLWKMLLHDSSEVHVWKWLISAERLIFLSLMSLWLFSWEPVDDFDSEETKKVSHKEKERKGHI